MLVLLSFVAVIAGVALGTWLLTRKTDLSSNDGYFLAGRRLSFPLIAGSLLLTNLSTEQMVGLNGAAFNDGLSVMVWEVVAVLALVAMALFFLPRFLRSGITTVPELLEERFGPSTQLAANIIFLVAYVTILLPIILYTGAAGMMEILAVPAMLGTSQTTTLWILVWAVGIVGSIYALLGGMRSIAVSDTLNGIGLLIGGLLVPFFGIAALTDGGFFEGLNYLTEAAPERFNSIGGADADVPVGTIFSGVLLINFFYWTTNQQIIQRTFGAKSLAEGQKGVLLTGALKLLGPLYLVVPGIVAYVMFQGQNVEADYAYGRLVNQTLPASLVGFFAAVLLGAVLSSFNSALNATCTLFSLGLYKQVFRPSASDQETVRASKIFGLILALAAMTVAPFLARTESIFDYLQRMNGIYFIPVFAVVLVGLLTRRVGAVAANTALMGGCLVIAIGYFVPPFSWIVDQIGAYHFVAIVFAWLLVLMLILGELYPRREPWQPNDSGKVDLTPWPAAKWCGLALFLIVLLIYALFADFSILN